MGQTFQATQGPGLFAANCASCHAYGYDDEDNALNLQLDAHRFIEFGHFPPNHTT